MVYILGMIQIELISYELKVALMTPFREEMKTMQDDDQTHGNLLISHITNSKVAAIFGEYILCRIGMHQGTWTMDGYLQKRFCMYCGRPQQRERHSWPPKAAGEYFQHGSCLKRITCLHCEKTKSIGIRHVGLKYVGFIPLNKTHCTRCGEDVGIEWDTWLNGVD